MFFFPRRGVGSPLSIFPATPRAQSALTSSRVSDCVCMKSCGGAFDVINSPRRKNATRRLLYNALWMHSAREKVFKIYFFGGMEEGGRRVLRGMSGKIRWGKEKLQQLAGKAKQKFRGALRVTNGRSAAIPGEHLARKRYRLLSFRCVHGERQADARGETLRNIFKIKKGGGGTSIRRLRSYFGVCPELRRELW